MQQQDSSDPTGVSGDRDSKQLKRARERKQNAALQMKIAGATWQEIAEVMGYPTARQALVAVEKALETQLKSENNQAKMRTLAGQRLERLLRSAWPKAINPEHPEHLVALTKVREVLRDHVTLYGLAAPSEVVVHSPTATEIERWVAQVVSASAPQIAEYDIFEGELVEPDDEDPDDGPPGVLALTGG